MTRWLTTLLVYTSAFVGAGLLATACDPSYTITAFRCDPSNPDCPDKFGTGGTYVCCSDDPAALSPGDAAATLPGYVNKSGDGIPLFSGANNALSSSGFCIDVGQVPPSAAIADPGPGQGCPLPCNPTWESDDVQAICGTGSVCCQTQELGENDCGFDPDLGDDGCWRPITGGDINNLGGLDATNWARSKHDTHQDPGGGGCETFVNASASQFDDAEDALAACYRSLSVANQRGFCQGGPCPLAAEGYRDACERKNDAEGRTGC